MKTSWKCCTLHHARRWRETYSMISLSLARCDPIFTCAIEQTSGQLVNWTVFHSDRNATRSTPTTPRSCGQKHWTHPSCSVVMTTDRIDSILFKSDCRRTPLITVKNPSWYNPKLLVSTAPSDCNGAVGIREAVWQVDFKNFSDVACISNTTEWTRLLYSIHLFQHKL
jgi:hypothetical protein